MLTETKKNNSSSSNGREPSFLSQRIWKRTDHDLEPGPPSTTFLVNLTPFSIGMTLSRFSCILTPGRPISAPITYDKSLYVLFDGLNSKKLANLALILDRHSRGVIRRSLSSWFSDVRGIRTFGRQCM